jgi:hypothetical protein
MEQALAGGKNELAFVDRMVLLYHFVFGDAPADEVDGSWQMRERMMSAHGLELVFCLGRERSEGRNAKSCWQ